MPPEIKLEPKRRDRKESLKEDLVRLRKEQDRSDETFYVVLKSAIEEGVFENEHISEKEVLFSHFALHGMIKCFEEMYYAFVTNFPPSRISSFLHTVCSSSGSDEDALKMARMLLVQIRKFEISDEQFWFAAIAATVQYSRLTIARALLTKWKEISVPPQKSDKDGKIINTLATALLKQGVKNNSVEAVPLALQSSCEIEASLVVNAATLTESTILEMLLDAGADITSKNAVGETPFLAAVRSGSLANVKFLIRTQKKHSTRELIHIYPAMLIAIENRRSEILKELLNAGGYVHLPTCLRACIANGDFDCFKMLFPDMKTAHFIELNAVLTCLVSHQKYDMLSFALFECPNTADTMKINDFERLLKKATDDDIKSLLQKKIDIMNGKGESHVKVEVKEEPD